jgi:transposase
VWIAQVLEHGLLRGSFVPPAPLRDLRDLTRYRATLAQERARVANRLHKVLQDAGIKLASVASDLLGVSGRAMLQALAHGTTDPAVLADLARGKLRAKLPALRQALAGRFRDHHGYLVGQLLAHLDYLEDASHDVSARIDALLVPFAPAVARLDTIPGLSQQTAEVVVAEIGADVRGVFPTAGHLASWAGLCPGQRESAGKRHSGRLRKGNRWLRAALVQAAHAAIRVPGSALAARYRRLRHRGHHKAVIGVAHALLVTAYHVLADETPYRELGADYYDRRHGDRVRRRALKALEAQGYRVTLERVA